VRAQLLVPAAGMGARLGYDMPKALVPIEGVPMVVRTLRRFDELGLTAEAVVVVPPGHEDVFRDAVEAHFPKNAMVVISGGAERQQSVEKGLDALMPDTDIVVIHDAARPFVDPESVEASIDAAMEYGAATVAIPSSDTILVGDEEAFLVDTPRRDDLWQCQTPQTFEVDVVRDAHAEARKGGYAVTDDATVVQRAGGRVKLVMGSALNFKITTPTDLILAEALQREGIT